MILLAKHLGQPVRCSVATVYNFVSNPENLPKWAAGLSQSKIHKEGDFWIADSPMGEVKIKFAPKNDFGILDHDVTLPSGEVNHNPFRVLKNGDGCELIFTLYRQPQMTDQAYANDAEMIKKDLLKVREIIEAKT